MIHSGANTDDTTKHKDYGGEESWATSDADWGAVEQTALVTFLCTPLPHAEVPGQNHVSTNAQGNINFQTSFKESNDWKTESANFQGATSETAETSSLDFFSENFPHHY